MTIFLTCCRYVYVFYLIRSPIPYECTTRIIMHIGGAHKLYTHINLWKLALRGPLNNDIKARDRTRNFFENNVLERRSATAPQDIFLNILSKIP